MVTPFFLKAPLFFFHGEDDEGGIGIRAPNDEIRTFLSKPLTGEV
jgi:hypothetical protein